MVFSGDGKTADVTLFGNLTNAVAYKVTCKDTSLELTAKVGEVTRVAILTASAEENVKTPIEFKLFDADGIDVTPSINLNTTCFVNVEGNYTAAELVKAAKASITMDTVGATVTVTVIYNSNAVGAQDVTATQEIKCVSAKAAKGQLLYYQVPGYLTGSQINGNSSCAKFYKGLSSQNISIDKADGADSNIYLCAKDAEGEVISYDSYEVESVDESVATVSVDVDNGKFAQITVTPNEVGSTRLNITATKNGAETYYTIPVTVWQKYEGVNLTFKILSNSTLSNVDDPDYGAEIIATMTDRNGQRLASGDYSVAFEIVSNNPGNKVKVGSSKGSNDGVGTNPWDGYHAWVTAGTAAGGSYTIEATATDNNTGNSIKRRVIINVKELKATNNKYALTYQIETTQKNVAGKDAINGIDLNPNDLEDDCIYSRLYATCNGLFAGYVRGDGSTKTGANVTIANGTVTPTNETEIEDVTFIVKYGNKVFTADLANATTGGAIAIPNSGAGAVRLDGVNGTTINYDVKTKKAAGQLASLGTYTIEYSYTKDSKTAKTTKTFTVKNSVVLPTYTITTKSVESTALADIKAVIKANVDMNNNTSDHESITDITADAPKGNSVYVKTITITEKECNAVIWNYTFTINTTFKAD